MHQPGPSDLHFKRKLLLLVLAAYITSTLSQKHLPKIEVQVDASANVDECPKVGASHDLRLLTRVQKRLVKG